MKPELTAASPPLNARVFDRVYTIELDPRLAADATEYPKRWPNVKVIQGDGLAEPPHVRSLPDVKDAIVFLDGHFSGGVTARGDVEEPAVLEIEMLGQHRSRIRGVIIDDFRCFGSVDWPSKSSLLRSIEETFSLDANVKVHLDQVILSLSPAPPAVAGVSKPKVD